LTGRRVAPEHLVIDASVSASWLFDDENDPYAEAVLAALEGAEAIVPQLWHYEMRNILLVARRRQRITAPGLAERIAALTELPLASDLDPDLDRAMELAERHALTFYDALYLELARRRDAPLATLDAALQRAAKTEGLAFEPG
jgi:predicted nucleic acid-binding protein